MYQKQRLQYPTMTGIPIAFHNASHCDLPYSIRISMACQTGAASEFIIVLTKSVSSSELELVFSHFQESKDVLVVIVNSGDEHSGGRAECLLNHAA